MVIKSLMKISVYKILKNKFKIKNISKPIESDLCVPINRFYNDLNFIYETDSTCSTLYCKKHWFTHAILFILVSNIIRNLIYTFFNSNDKFFRLSFGDLIEFVVDKNIEISYITISLVGFTCYST